MIGAEGADAALTGSDRQFRPVPGQVRKRADGCVRPRAQSALPDCAIRQANIPQFQDRTVALELSAGPDRLPAVAVAGLVRAPTGVAGGRRVPGPCGASLAW